MHISSFVPYECDGNFRLVHGCRSFTFRSAVAAASAVVVIIPNMWIRSCISRTVSYLLRYFLDLSICLWQKAKQIANGTREICVILRDWISFLYCAVSFFFPHFFFVFFSYIHFHFSLKYANDLPAKILISICMEIMWSSTRGRTHCVSGVVSALDCSHLNSTHTFHRFTHKSFACLVGSGGTGVSASASS